MIPTHKTEKCSLEACDEIFVSEIKFISKWRTFSKHNSTQTQAGTRPVSCNTRFYVSFGNVKEGQIPVCGCSFRAACLYMSPYHSSHSCFYSSSETPLSLSHLLWSSATSKRWRMSKDDNRRRVKRYQTCQRQHHSPLSLFCIWKKRSLKGLYIPVTPVQLCKDSINVSC